MDAPVESLLDELRCVWRFRWLAVISAFVTAVFAWTIIFLLPDRFEAYASVFVDARSALRPALQGLTVEQDVGVQLNYVRQSLLTGPQLERIAKESGVLGKNVVDEIERARILTQLGDEVALTMRNASGRDGDGGGQIYSFNYVAPSRTGALKVVETVLDTFVEETLGGKRKGSESAQRFLESQIKLYEQRLREAEGKLADFKRANVGLMPAEGGGYFGQLQAQLDATRQTQAALALAERKFAELTRQMRGDTVVGATAIQATGVAGMGTDTVSRIKEAQVRLDELLLRYTDRHPDVIAVREILLDLKQRRSIEIDSLRRGDSTAVANSGIATNPVVQNLQMQMNQTEVEVASLRAQLAQNRDKTDDLRTRLNSAPEVEALYAQLNRDYEVNRAQYTNLLSNYEKARLGEQADNAGSIRFEIVTPPTAEFGPVSPRRTLLLAGALLVAAAVGGGVAFLMHLVRPVVVSVRGLSELVDLPVLGAVMAAFPEQLARENRRDVRQLFLASFMLLVAFVLVLFLNWRGLRLAPLLGLGG
ncbi:MAG: hypothetical protein NT064_02890 [Proteobacteria bacterium]|nr:hypothetical protein [Pseudomonadota bacterium]